MIPRRSSTLRISVALVLVLAACARTIPPSPTVEGRVWAQLVGQPLMLRSASTYGSLSMLIGARSDGWVDLYFSSPDSVGRIRSAIVSAASTTQETTVSHVLTAPDVIERFASQTTTALGPPGDTVTSAEWLRWRDSVYRESGRIQRPLVRFNLGNPRDTARQSEILPAESDAFWMTWIPLTERRTANTYYSLYLGLECFAAGPYGSRLEKTLTGEMSNEFVNSLHAAATRAMEFRGQPRPLSGVALERGDLACLARPMIGNPVPHFPSRDSAHSLVGLDVRLDLVVDSTGRVSAPLPPAHLDDRQNASVSRVLMREATETLRQWRFVPARFANGRSAAQRVRAFIRFLPPAAREVPAVRWDSAAIAKAALAAEQDSADVLVLASGVPRGEEDRALDVTTPEGVRIHVSDGGPGCGVPIVLTNYPGASVERWRQVMEVLRERRRVITYDLRGNGLSSPSPQRDYSMIAHVRDLSAVLDSLNVRPALLVSMADGWKIPLAYAAQAPKDRVASVLAIGPTDMRSRPRGTEPSFFADIMRMRRGDDRLPSGALKEPLLGIAHDRVLLDVRRADSTALFESLKQVFDFDPTNALRTYTGWKTFVGVTAVPGQPAVPDSFGVRFETGPTGYASLIDAEAVVRAIEDEASLLDRLTPTRSCRERG